MKGLRKNGNKKEKRRGKAVNLKTGVSVAALTAAVAMFVILLQIEKSVLSQYEKGFIYTAAVPIPRGEVITAENAGRYFRLQELDMGCIPETALRKPEQVQGLAALFDVEPGVLLTEGMFERLDDVLKEMREPVIAGFKAEDMCQVAGGILRAGDRVHIYSIMGEDSVLVWEQIYVQQVFDGAGVRIPNEDTTTPSQRINIYLDKEDVGIFYRGLAEGNLRVVKICEQTGGEAHR